MVYTIVMAGAHTDEILTLLQQGEDGKLLSYKEIGQRCGGVTPQRVEQIKKQAEEQGISVGAERKVGRPKGPVPISPSLRFAIRLLKKYPDTTYEDLCRDHNVTRSQLSAGQQRAVQDGFVVKSGKERQGTSIYQKMLVDLLDVALTLSDIATRHGTSKAYVSKCIIMARASGEDVPSRRTPSNGKKAI